ALNSLPNQLTMPYWLSLPASMIRMPIQIIVSQADFSSSASCHVSTRSMNINATPIAAASDAPMSMSSPNTHNTNSPTKINAILISLDEIGPIVSSSRCASAVASGVARTVGRVTHSNSGGTSARHNSPGTSVAIAQSVQLIVTPWSAASFTTSGLPAIAVTNMAAVTMLAWNAHRIR